MKHLRAICIVLTVVLVARNAWAEGEHAVIHEDYVRLLKATKYVENFRSAAVVSARVSSARAQGSDAEYARFMGVIASANLSGVDDCLAAVYETQDLTNEEVRRLVAIFESPLGTKLIGQSSRMFIADVERGRHEAMPSDAFTEEEKEGIKKLQLEPAYQKYALMTTNKVVGAGMMKCFLNLEAVKKAGFKQ